MRWYKGNQHASKNVRKVELKSSLMENSCSFGISWCICCACARYGSICIADSAIPIGDSAFRVSRRISAKSLRSVVLLLAMNGHH